MISIFECARCGAIVVTLPLLLKITSGESDTTCGAFFFDFCFALFTTAVVVVHQIHGHELCEINNSYTIEYDRVRPIKLIASMTINKFTCGSLTLFTYFGCDELEKKVKFLRSAAWTSHNQFFCRFDQTHIFSPTEFETPQ